VVLEGLTQPSSGYVVSPEDWWWTPASATLVNFKDTRTMSVEKSSPRARSDAQPDEGSGLILILLVLLLLTLVAALAA